MCIKKTIKILIVASTAGMLYAGPAAAVLVSPFVGVNVGVKEQNLSLNTCMDIGSISASTGCSIGGLTGTAQAQFDPTAFSIGNLSRVTSSGSVAAKDMIATSALTFLDIVTIENSGLTGQTGSVVYSIGIDGTFNLQNVVGTTTKLQFGTIARHNSDAVAGQDQVMFTNAGGSPVNTTFVTNPLPFIFGDAFNFIIQTSSVVIFENVSGTSNIG